MSHRSLPAPWQRPAPSPAEWDVADVARGAAGRTVVVTGASTGIGFAAAELLAPHAAHVLTVSPDEAQGAAAAAVLRSRVPGARVSHVTCDLADLAQVRRAAVRITESANGRIDLLLNNAGVAAVPPGLTRDGFETHLGVNHLGHFALTGLLMPALLRSPRPRVVNVSSVLHRLGRPHPHTPHRPPRYHRWRAYADSKLANLLFTTGLNLWAREHGMPLSAVSAHPGLVRTTLGSDALHAAGRPREAAALRWLQARWHTPAQAAVPLLRAAVDGELADGACVGPGGRFEIRGPAVRVRTARRANDPEAARRLWHLSAALTDVTYPGTRTAPPAGDPVADPGQLPRTARALARLGRTGVFRRLGPRVLPRVDLACHRWTGGRWMPSGAAVPTLVLDTVDSGGITRSTPLLTVREPGGGFLVMGTNFGRARHPAWSQRLLRTPAATVHWRGRRIPVRARRLGEAELRAAHGRITRAMPVFDAYVRHSGREVRVFRLTPSWPDGR